MFFDSFSCCVSDRQTDRQTDGTVLTISHSA